MQPANGIIDKDEDGWIRATPKLFLPKAEEPYSCAPRAPRQDLIKSKAFFRKTCSRVSMEKERVCVAISLES